MQLSTRACIHRRGTHNIIIIIIIPGRTPTLLLPGDGRYEFAKQVSKQRAPD
jgi:hypothetical protein